MGILFLFHVHHRSFHQFSVLELVFRLLLDYFKLRAQVRANLSTKGFTS